MKQEMKDIVTELATRTAPAGGLTLASAPWWQSLNWAAVLSGLLVVLQILYLLRKWWREESDWGQKLKRRFSRRPVADTTDMELDE